MSYIKRHILFWLTMGLITAFLISFSSYSAQLTSNEVVQIKKADGLVVFTGEARRINVGLSIFQNKKAANMLISGVNDNISRKGLARKHSRYNKILTCCVDLDYKALDTIGNARETALWAKKKKLKSLIVVTSAYHMPRSLLLLKQQLDDEVELKPFPVKLSHFDEWWTSTKSTKIVVVEYFKYIASMLSIELKLSS